MTNEGVKRREVIGLAAAGTAFAGMSARLAAQSADDVGGGVVIDTLGGLFDLNPGRDGEAEPNRAELRTIPEAALADATASGATTMLNTVGYVFGEGEPFEETVTDIGLWDSRVRNSGGRLAKILSAADILRAKSDGKVGIIYGTQNAAMLGDDAGRVDLFADLGIRSIQLTYNPENTLGGGSLVPDTTGLTDFGRNVIDAINANRLIVDLSHSNRRTCLDAAAFSDRPISVDHTGCRALADIPRNKSDEELRAVAEKGGYVGIYFMPFLNLAAEADTDDVVAHIDHAVQICGEDHVGIGSDGTTRAIDDLAAYRRAVRADNEERHRLGIAAEGERLDMIPVIPALTGPDKFRRIAGALSAHGYSAARIDKIMGENFLRFARDIWGE